MRNWRVLTAVIAVVLAVVAAVLAWAYLDKADQRAQEDVELVEALRAADDIPRGTTGEAAVADDLVEVFEVPRNAVPSSIIADTADLDGLVAAAKVSQGQFITSDTFVAPTQVEGFSSSIEEGKEAISLQVDLPAGVGGFIVPNDTVNVLVTTTIDVGPEPNVKPPQPIDLTAFVAPGLKVLAVDEVTVGEAAAVQSTDDGDSTDTETTTSTRRQGVITVEVTPRQAEQIAHAENGQGELYLSLNPPGFDPGQFTVPAEIVEQFNWFDQNLDVYQQVVDLLGSAG